MEEVDICALPEGCIATLLSLTTPKDVCRLSRVSTTFRSASQSDAVWTPFLPSHIISRAADAHSLLSKFHSKKGLYLHLSDHPVLIDQGLKSFWLEKSTGNKCFMLAAKHLTIVWGNDTRYWQWIEHPGSMFSEVAELLRVRSFELSDKINVHMLSSGIYYVAYLVFMPQSTTYGFAPHFGRASVGVNGRKCEKQSVYLDSGREPRAQLVARCGGAEHELHAHNTTDQNWEYPKRRDDGWMEVELGECFVNEGEDGDFEVRLLHNKRDWKSGLVIQGIEIRPKEGK